MKEKIVFQIQIVQKMIKNATLIHVKDLIVSKLFISHIVMKKINGVIQLNVLVMVVKINHQIVLMKRLKTELVLLIQKIVKKKMMEKIVKNVMEVLIAVTINVLNLLKIVDFAYMKKIVKNVKLEIAKTQTDLIVKINLMIKNVKI